MVRKERQQKPNNKVGGVDTFLFFAYNVFVLCLHTNINMTNFNSDSDLDYAEWITDQYLYHAVQSINARLGKEYAIKNPSLVSTMVSLTAQEFQRQNSQNKEDIKKVSTKHVKPNSSFQFVNSPTKKPRFKFSSFGIPVGATLHYINDPNITCTVSNSSNDVIFNGKKTSMSFIVNSFLGGSNRGTSYWSYNGKLLVDLYNQKY